MTAARPKFWVVLAMALAIACLVACSENPLSLGGTRCNVGSEKLINWDEKPTFADGYLTMSGTTKGNARIHDPVASRTGTNWPAFGLNDLTETGDNYRLDPLASIYPRAMRDRIAGGGRPELYATTYNVTATSFDIQVAVPSGIATKNMVVSVWGKNPNFDSRAIGAECINYREAAQSRSELRDKIKEPWVFWLIAFIVASLIGVFILYRGQLWGVLVPIVTLIAFVIVECG